MSTEENPLITALPKLMDADEFKEKFSRTPAFEAGDSIDRLLQADKIITELVISLSRHYYFYQRVVTKMHESYRLRGDEDVIKRLREISELTEEETLRILIQEIDSKPSVFGTYLMSIGGGGKTTMLNFLVKSFPRVIIQTFHPQLVFKQIPILRIETPHRSSRKDLCYAILNAMDVLLGTTYEDDYKYVKENKLTNIVKTKVLIHFVGTIIIDEFQDLRSASGPTELTLAFIKSISNTLKVPIVFVGSLQAEEILFANFQLCTRSFGYTWERFEEGSSDWNKFFDQLFSQSVLDGTQIPTESLKHEYYRATAGVPRLLTTLHSDVQKLCLTTGRKEITELEVKIVEKNLMRSTHAPTKAIINHNSNLLNAYSDLQYLPFKPKQNGKKKTQAVNNMTAKKNAPEPETKNPATVESNVEEFDVDRTLIDIARNCRSGREYYNMLLDAGVIRSPQTILDMK